MSGYLTEKERQAQMNKPKLVVRILEARGIRAADIGGTSDPFVELRIKGQSHSVKTKTIKKTLSPFWNEEHTLFPSDWEKEFLDLKLYDEDANSNNDLLGELEIPIAVFVNRAPVEEWRELGKRHGHDVKADKKHGEIKLWIAHVPPGAPVPQQGAPAPGAYPQQPYPGAYPPQQQGAYPPQGYPPQQQAYYPPPQQGGYPPQQPYYPPQQQAAYPPPQQAAYPPQQQPYPGAYPAQPGYPPQQAYPPQPGYPPQGYPPQGYPPQQGYPPRQY